MDTENIEVSGNELIPQEVEMAKSLGLVKDEPVEDKEDIAEEKPVEEKPADTTDEDISFEKEEALVKDFNSNEKKLYWERKKERTKRQEAQREKELTSIQLVAAKREIELLKNGTRDSVDNSETEEAQQVDEDDEKIMTVGEFKRMQKTQADDAEKQKVKASEIISRVKSQEAEAKSKYADYDEVTLLAADLINTNKSYAMVLAAAARDPNENVADVAYNIGRLHPKYAVKKTENKTIDRAIKNSEKRATSASVSGGSKTITSEEDLSVDDVSKMTPNQYSMLKPETRDRILRESCGV